MKVTRSISRALERAQDDADLAVIDDWVADGDDAAVEIPEYAGSAKPVCERTGIDTRR
jgi:hypothetical protein